MGRSQVSVVASAPSFPCTKGECRAGTRARLGTEVREARVRPQLCGTVPGEGDAACVKDLPEEVAACSAWGEEGCTRSDMALSSPAELTPRSSLASCLAGVTHRLHRLQCAAGEGCPPGTGLPWGRTDSGSQYHKLTWHRSSTQIHPPGYPAPWQGQMQLHPAAPGQAALALHGSQHPLPERERAAREAGWVPGPAGSLPQPSSAA